MQPVEDPPLADGKTLGYLPVSVHGDELGKLLPDLKQYGDKAQLRPLAPFFGVATSSPGGRRLLREDLQMPEGSGTGNVSGALGLLSCNSLWPIMTVQGHTNLFCLDK